MSFTINLVDRARVDALLPMLSRISEAAFARPPWNIKLDHLQLLTTLAAFEGARVYAAVDESAAEVRGFSVGTVLDGPTLDFFRVPAACGVGVGDYHLSWRAVHPDHQGAGLGRALVQTRLDHARSLGCGAVLGDTRSDNLPTMRLYQALGFVECDRRRAVRRDVATVYFMKTRFTAQEGQSRAHIDRAGPSPIAAASGPSPTGCRAGVE